MTKATHNGTCQACGRSQAVSRKHGTLAKHGYTTESGYFNGTCSGSDRRPLEQETTHNVDVVAAVRDWANKQDMFADGNIEKVTVSVRDPEGPRAYSTKEITVNLSEYIALKTRDDSDTDFSDLYKREFEKKVESVRFGLRRNATFARKDADILEALRDKTFGNHLTPREVEDAPQPKRESFSADSEGRANAKAYDRQRELKAEGIRSRVTGDARYATISYRK